MEAKQENKQVGVIAYLNSLTAIQIADDEKVKDKFITMVDTLHGSGSGAAVYEGERHYFNQLIQINKDLKECTRLSIYGAFIDCAVQGLSFDPSRKLAYLLWDNHNVGTHSNPVYEKRARLAISPYGELYLRQKYGQIKHADTPEVVYEGEEFMKVSGKDGTLINHTIIYPRPQTRIVAAYCRLVKPDGSVDYAIMDRTKMERLKEYSSKKNGGNPSKLYGTATTDIDSGFMIAKLIKHAFSVYPKVKLKGDFTVFATDLDPDPIDDISYDLMDDDKPKSQDPTPKPEVQPNLTNMETAQMTMKPDEKAAPEPEDKPIANKLDLDI